MGDSKLAGALGKRGKGVPMTLEMPTCPGHKIGLRPLTEKDTEIANSRAIEAVRRLGFIGSGDEEAAASLAQVLGTKDGRGAVANRSGLVGAMAVIANSELGYAMMCEELTLSLCDVSSLPAMPPLVQDSDELRDTLERPEVEWLAGKLEQWMADRAPQRIHMTREQIKEVASAAKKGQRPTIAWNSCAYSTLLDCVSIMAETLVTCGGETSSSSTPDGPAPSP